MPDRPLQAPHACVPTAMGKTVFGHHAFVTLRITDFPHYRVPPKLPSRPFLTDSGAFQSPSADVRKSEECRGVNDVPGGDDDDGGLT